MSGVTCASVKCSSRTLPRREAANASAAPGEAATAARGGGAGQEPAAGGRGEGTRMADARQYARCRA